MNDYSLVVGNIGEVWKGKNGFQANLEYSEWIKMSKRPNGRASGEDVTLFKNEEPWKTKTMENKLRKLK